MNRAHFPHWMVALIAAFFLLQIQAAAPVELHTIALSKTPAPNTTALFDAFQAARVNRAGDTAFTALLQGAGVGSQNNGGLWVDTFLDQHLVARNNDLVPGSTTIRFKSIDAHVINWNGEILLKATLSGAGIDTLNDESLWLVTWNPTNFFQESVTVLVAREGTQASDAPEGVLWKSFDSVSLNDFSRITFRATLRGSGVSTVNDEGIWSGYADAYRDLWEGTASWGFMELPPLENIARKGNPVPNTPDGVTWDTFGTPCMNGLDQVAFVATLKGTGIGSANNSGVWIWDYWRGTPNTFSLVARRGSPATDVGVAANWNGFGDPILNDYGDMAFTASLTGLGVTAQNSNLLVYGEPGYLSGISPLYVARSGMANEDLPPGVMWTSFGDPVINHRGYSDWPGALAFDASITGLGVTANSNQGIWLGIPDANDVIRLELIARKNDFVEGTPDNVRYESLGAPVLDEESRIAFEATLTGSYNKTSVWGMDTNNELGLIVREGDFLPVDPNNPDDQRWINAGSLSLVTDRRFDRNAFGGSQVAFNAAFNDNTSGLFLASFNKKTDVPSGPEYKDLEGIILWRPVTFREYTGGFREIPFGREPDNSRESDTRTVGDDRTFGMSLTLRTLEGKVYRLEAADDLKGRWETVGPDIRGTGDTTIARIPIDSDKPMRFIRFREISIEP